MKRIYIRNHANTKDIAYLEVLDSGIIVGGICDDRGNEYPTLLRLKPSNLEARIFGEEKSFINIDDFELKLKK